MKKELVWLKEVDSTSLQMSLRNLNNYQQLEVYKTLEGILMMQSTASAITDEIRENRFAQGKSCIHCKSSNVVRNGKRNNIQRYLCKYF